MNKKSAALKVVTEPKPLLPISMIGVQSVGGFKTSPDSPFPDGYDIAAEKLVVAHLLEADDPDPSDPLFQRYLDLDQRERDLRQMQSKARIRQNADKLVDDGDATAMNRIGRLVATDDDVMELHTQIAYRLFIGRDNNGTGRPAVSGKRVAAVLRAFWLMSGNNNPYADWALIQVEAQIVELRQKLKAATAVQTSALEALKAKGLRLSVVRSEFPVEVKLGFQSPYGFQIAELMVEVDYFCRVVKTLVARDQLSSREGHKRIVFDGLHPARSIFESLVPIQRMLQREEMVKLTRSDWASKDDLAQKRVRFAVECFGVIPRNILTAEVMPRHTRLKAVPNAKELKMLADLPLEGGAPTTDSARLLV